MKKRISIFFNRILKIYNLKRRMVIMLVISSLIPILLIGFISYYAIYSLLCEKMHMIVQSNLAHKRNTLENYLETLNNITNQLLYEDILGNELTTYFDSSNEFDKAEILKRLNSQILLMEFTNSDIANISYYYRNGSNVISKLNNSQTGDSLPEVGHVLGQNHNSVFYGPHKTASRLNDYQVISTVKRFGVYNMPELYVYVETGYKKMEMLFSDKQFGIEAYQALISSDGFVEYIEDSGIIAQQTFTGEIPSQYKSAQTHKTYFTFTETSKYGWKMVLFVDASVYYKEIRLWAIRYAVIAVVSIMLSVIIAVAIWRMVYKPVRSFDRELKRVLESNTFEDLKKVNVEEFDEYLIQFQKMREKILQLVASVEKETHEKSELEIQILINKINPHFLMNTLDTVKWYADTKQQGDIVKMVSSLNKLLHYNLQKGEKSTVRQELAALGDYILLQSIKYDLNYEEHINVPEKMLDTKVPKFLFQPLVENAIFHGIEGSGEIGLQIDQTEDGQLAIMVSDKGIGMTEDKVTSILEMRHEATASRHGIGLSYIVRLLKHMFEGRSSFDIKSKPGEGTAIIIKIPVETDGRNYI